MAAEGTHLKTGNSIRTPHARLRLLIVHGDDTLGRGIEQAALQVDRFWPVRRMTDGRFALEHLWECIDKNRDEVPDVVITDLQVKALGGIALTRELRRYAETQAMLIAFIATNASPLDQDAAESAGADFFVRRPPPERLAALLNMIANRAEAKAPVTARLLN